MKWLKLSFLFLIMFVFMFSGCMKVEKKYYEVVLNDDGSGEGTIVFYNLFSENDEEGSDNTKEDFETLINDYIEGSTFEDEHPGLNVTDKELEEVDGVLCGIVTFTFDEPAGIGLYKHDADSPWMYWPGTEDEEYYDSEDGEFGSDIMPMIFWAGDTKEFVFMTSANEFSEECRSLLPRFYEWEEGQ